MLYGNLKYTGTLTVNQIYLSVVVSTCYCHISYRWHYAVCMLEQQHTLKTSSYWLACVIWLTVIAADGIRLFFDSWTNFLFCSLTKQVSFLSSLKSQVPFILSSGFLFCFFCTNFTKKAFIVISWYTFPCWQSQYICWWFQWLWLLDYCFRFKKHSQQSSGFEQPVCKCMTG